MTFFETAAVLIFTFDILFLLVGICRCKEKVETIEHV
jgi:hypothetical protein